MSKVGRVYLVGAGCGDYDLITLRGKRLLERCEVVVYDSLIDTALLNFVPKNAEKICVGKRGGHRSETQENINKILVQKACEGKMTVRLKGGDPFVFGRGGEELLALKEYGIEYEVVPGISSSIAVPELAGIPVTHRRLSRSFHVITGHTAENVLPENMAAYAKLDGTMVFLMGIKNLRQISESLIKNGKSEDTPTAVITNGACVNQKIVRGTLKNIASRAEESGAKSPGIIVVGEVADFDFSQTISLPLKSTSVTVTGTGNFVNKLSDKLERLGARVSRLDCLNVVEYQNNHDFDNSLLNASSYNYIVLTSINGAEIFFGRLAGLKIDIRNLCGIKFAVIGSGTAAVLEKHGIFADIIPDSFTSEALALRLCDEVKNGEKVLILRAKQGSAVLCEILDKNNIAYDYIKTYDVLSDFEFSNTEIDTDFITFASSSGVNAFFENGGKISVNTKIVSIGEITAAALRTHGVNDFFVSKTSSTDGIAETILRLVSSHREGFKI